MSDIPREKEREKLSVGEMAHQVLEAVAAGQNAPDRKLQSEFSRLSETERQQVMGQLRVLETPELRIAQNILGVSSPQGPEQMAA